MAESAPRTKWQYMSAFLYTKQEGGLFETKSRVTHLVVGAEDVTGDAVNVKLDSLGDLGWEMVSVAPAIGTSSAGIALNLVAIDPVRDTETLGYWLWFKRPA